MVNKYWKNILSETYGFTNISYESENGEFYLKRNIHLMLHWYGEWSFPIISRIEF